MATARRTRQGSAREIVRELDPDRYWAGQRLDEIERDARAVLERAKEALPTAAVSARGAISAVAQARVALRAGNAASSILAALSALSALHSARFALHFAADFHAGHASALGRMLAAPLGGKKRAAKIAGDPLHKAIKNEGIAQAAKHPTWTRHHLATEIAPLVGRSTRQVERVLEQHGIPESDT